MNKKGKGEFLRSIGKMYLNSKGVDIYKIDAKTYRLVGINARTGMGFKITDEDGHSFWAEKYISVEEYSKKIDHEIPSIELDRALSYLDIS